MNATRLADESRETLDRLAGYLKQHPALEVVLEGHTDDLGGPDVNHPLSRMRANRARSWLVAQGIDTARIAVHNFGSSKPVAPGRTAEARAQNRRVEITVRERID
jgi:outer membrane protein OmpA-like peptidoglycan-associated protein